MPYTFPVIPRIFPAGKILGEPRSKNSSMSFLQGIIILVILGLALARTENLFLDGSSVICFANPEEDSCLLDYPRIFEDSKIRVMTRREGI
jgi:hypothetical protein